MKRFILRMAEILTGMRSHLVRILLVVVILTISAGAADLAVFVVLGADDAASSVAKMLVGSDYGLHIQRNKFVNRHASLTYQDSLMVRTAVGDKGFCGADGGGEATLHYRGKHVQR